MSLRAAFLCILLWSLLASAARSQSRSATEFFLEPGLQYGGALERQRFRESNGRLSADVGLLYRLGDERTATNRIGIALHASVGSRDAYFAVRPRFTRRLNDMVAVSVSAGWIFATPQQDGPPEDATLSEDGFVGGVLVSHGDVGVGVDVRVLDVGPSVGYDGGTETTLLGGIHFLGKPGLQAAAFGAGIILVLAAIYAASL